VREWGLRIFENNGWGFGQCYEFRSGEGVGDGYGYGYGLCDGAGLGDGNGSVNGSGYSSAVGDVALQKEAA
jgi:hypothetical protein